MNPSGTTTSVWMNVRPLTSYPSVQTDLECDVCIAGAGIAGLTTAYFLANAGLRVIVLEKFPQIAQGETSRTTAQLTCFTDFNYQQLKKYHGDNTAGIAQALKWGVDEMENIANRESIACDFRRVPVYLFATEDKHVKQLRKECDVLESLDLPVKWHDILPTSGMPPYPCLEIKNQAQFHALKYVYGLAEVVQRKGVTIFTNTQVTAFETTEQGALLQTEQGHQVSCRYAVAATNSPASERFGVHLKQAAYRTFVVGLRVEKGSMPYAIWWDTLDPYHYVRLVEEEGYDVLIVGGEDHYTGRDDRLGDTEQAFEALEAWARRMFPVSGERLYSWSGQVMESYDGIGFNGRHPADSPFFIITGDTGSGTVNGTLGARIVSDQILGIANSWEAFFDPGRFRLRAAPEWAREAGPMMWQFTDWVRPSEIDSASTLANGSGGLMRSGLKQIAVYKDGTGQVHKFNAACPHLGCVVQWNALENSWDCPCHGSRFSALGQLLNGPASTDLERVE